VFGDVVSVSHPAATFTRMKVNAPELARARPGQFLTVRCGSGVMPLLRRPLGVFSTDEGRGEIEMLFKTVGEGTRWLAERRPGDRVDLLGPIGAPFEPPTPPGRAVLVAGGVGVATMYPLAKALLEAGWSVGVLLGAATSAELLCRDELTQMGATVEAATEDGSAGTRGLVTDLLPSRLPGADIVFACGPWGMMATVAEMTSKAGVPCQVSLEQRMACGTGACMGCVVPIRGETGVDYKRVCREGPVFPAETVAWEDVE